MVGQLSYFQSYLQFTDMVSFDKTRNTQIFDGEVWSFGPNLPMPISNIFGLILNQNEIFFVGGAANNADLDKTWIYNTVTKTFTEKANLPLKRRELGCGKIEISGRVKIVCPGSSSWHLNKAYTLHNETLIYDLDGDYWTQGTDLPVSTHGKFPFVIDNVLRIVKNDFVYTYLPENGPGGSWEIFETGRSGYPKIPFEFTVDVYV